MIFRILLYAFLTYLLYKIIFDLIIPVYKTTRQMKKGFREMSAKMNEYGKTQQQDHTMQNNGQSDSQKPAGDYIEFEEVK